MFVKYVILKYLAASLKLEYCQTQRGGKMSIYLGFAYFWYQYADEID